MTQDTEEALISVEGTATDPVADAGTAVGDDAPAVGSPETALGLNRGDRRVVTVLVMIALLLMAAQWYRLTQVRPAPIEVLHPERYHFELEVNTATWVEWMQLDGVGETLARRIVQDRDRHGPFTSVDDVQRVKGIGPKTIETLRPHLKFTAATAPLPAGN